MNTTFRLPTNKKAPYSNRGGVAAARKFKLLIDNRYMTTGEVSKELGLTQSQTTYRIRREQKKDGPITLAGIGREK